MIAIQYQGRRYSARSWNDSHGKLFIMVSAAESYKSLDDEELARRWLCDHSLRKSKAKKLLAAALRGEGEFADENNKARVR